MFQLFSIRGSHLQKYFFKTTKVGLIGYTPPLPIPIFTVLVFSYLEQSMTICLSVSSVYPARQEHWNDPGVLVHSCPHCRLPPSKHSLMSAERKIYSYNQSLSLINQVSWPSGLAYRTQVLVLAAACGFESRP